MLTGRDKRGELALKASYHLVWANYNLGYGREVLETAERFLSDYAGEPEAVGMRVLLARILREENKIDQDTGKECGQLMGNKLYLGGKFWPRTVSTAAA